ncbi:hypothetical protein GTE6_9 [Gordonia phage GTE6]|uniref:Uncharacterized protein n=1 Tax=Gordonia phage GTE6 TaxID=1647474 RepID=A0A0K0MWF5_9CAUD|nr:hypothetical protein AU100_gp09 [Gordonia phage GTE6]AKI28651.1 hypothetical protein GTE6_9 [Gordonia phage GTE6]
MIGMIVHYTDTAGRTGIGYVTSRDEAAGTFRVCPAAGVYATVAADKIVTVA